MRLGREHLLVLKGLIVGSHMRIRSIILVGCVLVLLVDLLGLGFLRLQEDLVFLRLVVALE
jgi:hypothetical protein